MKSAVEMNTDEFCRDLARITAKHLRKLPPEERKYGLVRLQDLTSLYSPYTNDLIIEHLGGAEIHPSLDVLLHKGNRADDAKLWKRNHPKQWSWVLANKRPNNFAAGIIHSLGEFGRLTEKQQTALDKIVKETT